MLSCCPGAATRVCRCILGGTPSKLTKSEGDDVRDRFSEHQSGRGPVDRDQDQDRDQEREDQAPCVFVCRPLCLLRGLAAHRGVLEARSTQYVLRTVRVIDCARPGKFFRG